MCGSKPSPASVSGLAARNSACTAECQGPTARTSACAAECTFTIQHPTPADDATSRSAIVRNDWLGYAAGCAAQHSTWAACSTRVANTNCRPVPLAVPCRQAVHHGCRQGPLAKICPTLAKLSMLQALQSHFFAQMRPEHPMTRTHSRAHDRQGIQIHCCRAAVGATVGAVSQGTRRISQNGMLSTQGTTNKTVPSRALNTYLHPISRLFSYQSVENGTTSEVAALSLALRQNSKPLRSCSCSQHSCAADKDIANSDRTKKHMTCNR